MANAYKDDQSRNIDDKTKAKIEICVQSYIKLFPKEYEDVKTHIRNRFWDLQDTKWGEIKGDHWISRALFEIPETLDSIISTYLTDDEKNQWKSLKGARWFARRFKEFRNAEKAA